MHYSCTCIVTPPTLSSPLYHRTEPRTLKKESDLSKCDFILLARYIFTNLDIFQLFIVSNMKNERFSVRTNTFVLQSKKVEKIYCLVKILLHINALKSSCKQCFQFSMAQIFAFVYILLHFIFISSNVRNVSHVLDARLHI